MATSKWVGLTVPRLGSAEEVGLTPVTVTKILQFRGTVDQPAGGVALANIPELVELETHTGSQWGIVSQTIPGRVIIPCFGRQCTPDQYWSAPESASEIIITFRHTLTRNHKSLLGQHEMSGVVADQTMSLAAQSIMHYSKNALTLDELEGEAVSKFTYYVEDARRDLIQWRVLSIQCWLNYNKE